MVSVCQRAPLASISRRQSPSGLLSRFVKLLPTLRPRSASRTRESRFVETAQKTLHGPAANRAAELGGEHLADARGRPFVVIEAVPDHDQLEPRLLQLKLGLARGVDREPSGPLQRRLHLHIDQAGTNRRLAQLRLRRGNLRRRSSDGYSGEGPAVSDDWPNDMLHDVVSCERTGGCSISDASSCLSYRGLPAPAKAGVPGIQSATSTGANGEMDSGDKRRNDEVPQA